jgi:hypothetical protein
MLAALHAANYEGGLAFEEWLKATQIKGPQDKPTPSRATFCRKLKELTDQKVVEKSLATEKYLLSVKILPIPSRFLGKNNDGVSAV